MLKSFPIEAVRQALRQTLMMNKIADNSLFGGDNEICLFSFYEQLKTQEEVDRFVEKYRELTDQQNRTDLIGNGVLISPENPTITNLYSCLIIPMTWTTSIRVKLANRDKMIETIYKLVYELKGSKCDLAQLDLRDDNGELVSEFFKVGTIGHNDYRPKVNNGDFIGLSATNNLNTDIQNHLNILYSNGVETGYVTWVYYSKIVNYKLVLKVAKKIDGVWTDITDEKANPEVIFPPIHESFEKYKLSMSFDSIRCETPRTLNGEEYIEISFGGSATLVNESVKLGNDLVKVCIQKNKIVGATDTTINGDLHWLEPLELPSGNNASTLVSQLASNQFKQNTHTESIGLNLQYTFILDMNETLISQWFRYARYGTQATSDSGISPNMIYNVTEYWSSWGNFEKHTVLAKITENIAIENTESDTLTIGVNMQIQGENN